MRSDGYRVAWHDAACDQAFCNGYDLGLEFGRVEGRPLPCLVLIFDQRIVRRAPYTLLENLKDVLVGIYRLFQRTRVFLIHDAILLNA